MVLHQLEQIPAGFLDCRADQLHKILFAPSLIQLQGRREPPLFVSILLHGNEDTGLYAIQNILKRYQDKTLPRSLVLFVGNISAARLGLRRLPNQPDYNRAWPQGCCPNSIEAHIMRQVTDLMRERGVFISVDVHNNTGLNPHYACINRLDTKFLHLATLFSRTVVYFLRPEGVQSLAFSKFCPAVTIEAGMAGNQYSIEHTTDFLDACLHLEHLPHHAVANHDIDLFHTVANIKVPKTVSFEFSEYDDKPGPWQGVNMQFRADLDYLNFNELPANTPIAWLAAYSGYQSPLLIENEQGQQVTEQYMQVLDNQVCLVRSLMPAMFTLDSRVIRQDCLGYLMERLPLPMINSKE